MLGCGTITDPPPEDPYPLYWAIEKDGFIQGWASRDEAWCDCAATSFRASWSFPREPFLRLCEIEYRRESGAMVRYDWRVGPGAEPWLRGRLMPEAGGEFAWLATGWGDLDLARNLAPAAPAPRPFDARSPLSFELLGAAWDTAERPDSLDLSILRLDDPRDISEPEAARLFHEGQLDGGGFPVEGFHMTVGEETLHFKLFTGDFPLLWASLAGSIALQYWGESPPNLPGFQPLFPIADGYANEAVEIEGALGTVHGQVSVPESEEPFPAILMVAGAGPADRNQAALFGFLVHELAREGYFVLRCDKPGTGESEGSLFDLGLELRRQTIAAAWDSLSADPRVDPARRALLGYGEGAALALEAAGDLGAATVAAISPRRNRPAEMADIPEAIDGRFELLGLECFGGKHLDRLAFDPEAYLPALSVPVLLTAAGRDPALPIADVEEQAALIAQGGVTPELAVFGELFPAYNATVPDAGPSADFTQTLLTWFADSLP